MNREMARSGARRHRGKRRIVRDERSLFGVEAVHQHLVEPEVGDVREAIGGIDIDGVGVRCLLPLRVDARSRVLDEGRRRLQRAVCPDRHNRDASSTVIGNEHVAAGLVHHEVGRAASDRRLLIECSQPARVPVDGERADRSAGLALEFADLVRRIQIILARMHGQETRAGSLCRQFRRGQGAGSEIEAGDIHAFALLTRVSAEVHEHLAAGRRRSAPLTEGRHGEDGDGGDEESRSGSGRMKSAHRRIRYRLADEIKVYPWACY